MLIQPTPTWPDRGIHIGISEADYHHIGAQHGVLSKSLLWRFAANPHKFRHGPPVTRTAAMAWGSLVDCLLLTPEDFRKTYVRSLYDEFRTNEAKAWLQDIRGSGKEVVKPALCDAAMDAAQSVRAHPIAAAMLDGALKQVSVVGLYPPPLDVRVKARLDIVPSPEGQYRHWLADLKTIGRLDDIPRTIAARGYHVQAALYIDLWQAVSGELDRTRWALIFVESDQPYEVAIVELDPADIAEGRAFYQRAIARWVECQASDVWPSPWDGLPVVSRPAWAVARENEFSDAESLN